MEDIHRIDEGSHMDEVIEWWYFNAIFDQNCDLPGWSLIQPFTLARGLMENIHFVLIPPGKPVHDLSWYELPAGSIETSEKDVNVRFGKNFIRGKYPRWSTHMEKEWEGKKYALDLEYHSQVDSQFRIYQSGNSRLNHFAVFRYGVEGVVTLAGKKHKVTGVGYHEHMFGLIDPASSRGWIWYCVPRTQKEGLAINLALGVAPDDSIFHKFFYFTEDGKNYNEFVNYSFEIEEERELEGNRYPHRFRLREEKKEGKLDVRIIRAENPFARVHQSPFAKIAFVSGSARMEGRMTWKGKSYDLAGPSLGSAFLIVYEQPKE